MSNQDQINILNELRIMLHTCEDLILNEYQVPTLEGLDLWMKSALY